MSNWISYIGDYVAISYETDQIKGTSWKLAPKRAFDVNFVGTVTIPE